MVIFPYTALYCGGKDKAVAVVDVATQKKLRDIKDAHRSVINYMYGVAVMLIFPVQLSSKHSPLGIGKTARNR